MSYPSAFSPLFFFFNDTATTEIYTLSLHDALPIYQAIILLGGRAGPFFYGDYKVYDRVEEGRLAGDRKSTRLNSSHANISYAVFCLKKKKIEKSIEFTWYIKRHRGAQMKKLLSASE